MRNVHGLRVDPMNRTVLATPAVAPDASATTAPCPKCGTTMILAAVTPHPIVAAMQRHTFLCTTCNQTKTYMLPVAQ
jgi:predicted RNA-binding Zn-ribbon protein involved in translation (DUF1610 family)